MGFRVGALRPSFHLGQMWMLPFRRFFHPKIWKVWILAKAAELTLWLRLTARIATWQNLHGNHWLTPSSLQHLAVPVQRNCTQLRLPERNDDSLACRLLSYGWRIKNDTAPMTKLWGRSLTFWRRLLRSRVNWTPRVGYRQVVVSLRSSILKLGKIRNFTVKSIHCAFFMHFCQVKAQYHSRHGDSGLHGDEATYCS